MGFTISLQVAATLASLPVLLSGCIVYGGDGHHGCEDSCYEGGSSANGGADQGGGDVGGAPAVCDPSLAACPCSDTADCGEGLDCIDDKCVSACGFDFECADAEVCANGQCVPVCDEAGQCGEPGYACVGGACLADPLNPQCSSPTDCQGSPCVDGFCTSACITNADCAADFLCEAASGTCFQDLGPTLVCSDAIPCAGEGQTCSDGFCRYACATVQDCKLIDARFDACDAAVCKTDEELNPECGLGLPCAGEAPCVSNECVE